MTKNKINNNVKKIFILQGPNINLLNLKTSTKLTTDALNKHIRKKTQEINSQSIIFQTNEEGKAVGKLQQYRKKISSIILYPGPWNKSAYSILDLLHILKIPYITICTAGERGIFNGITNFEGDNMLKMTDKALDFLNKEII